jgi:hypothetical protein
MTGERQVGLDPNAAATVELDAGVPGENAGERRSLHACRPQDGMRRE